MSDVDYVKEKTTIKLCKMCKPLDDECNILIAKITNLEKQVNILEKSNEFYADEFFSWEGRKIIPHDHEITEHNRPSGGKLARQAQQQLKKLREGSEKWNLKLRLKLNQYV